MALNGDLLSHLKHAIQVTAAAEAHSAPPSSPTPDGATLRVQAGQALSKSCKRADASSWIRKGTRKLIRLANKELL